MAHPDLTDEEAQEQRRMWDGEMEGVEEIEREMGLHAMGFGMVALENGGRR